jgi:hypothetical protein
MRSGGVSRERSEDWLGHRDRLMNAKQNWTIKVWSGWAKTTECIAFQLSSKGKGYIVAAVRLCQERGEGRER